MNLQGVSDEIARILEPVSKLESIRDYILIGGTSLSLQLGHRLSQDLDFCKWPLPAKSEIDWPLILAELRKVFTSAEPDILDFNQVNFIADGIRLSFYSNHLYKSPTTKTINFLNNIKIPDIETIGVMKLEVMLRRSNFRDYYDIYSILKKGIPIKKMVEGAVRYSNHNLKTRDILNFISSGDNFKKDSQFNLLKPAYNVSEKDIEKLIRDIIVKEYSTP